MAPEVIITNMTEKHLPEMLDLIETFLDEQQAIEPLIEPNPDWRDHMEDFLRRMIPRDDYHVRIMTASGNIIGFTMLGVTHEPVYKRGMIGYIADLFVYPGLRKHGMGTQLFVDAKEILEKQGCNTIQLNVLSENPQGKAFWEKMGFKTYMHRMKLDD